MRTHYWSLSKFAGKLRIIFGLPPMLNMGTIEEWDEFDNLEKSKSKLGVSIINSLDTIQNIVYFIPDKTRDIAYYISNILNQTHVLKTRTHLGKHGDLVSKIPDALFLSIVDFVEQECFWMNILCVSSKIYPSSIERYKNQSYLRRKLFPIRISSELRQEYGLEYLAWQKKNTDNSDTINCIDELIDAYKFAKERYFTFDPYEESGYNKLPKSGLMRITDEQRECFNIIRSLEKEFDSQAILHMTNIVKNHNYLWT